MIEALYIFNDQNKVIYSEFMNEDDTNISQKLTSYAQAGLEALNKALNSEREVAGPIATYKVFQLFTIDAHRVFGTVLNIPFRIFLVANEAVVEDAAKSVLVTVTHELYHAMMSPFYVDENNLNGVFKKHVLDIIKGFNDNSM